jgi:hypothetical protein
MKKATLVAIALVLGCANKPQESVKSSEPMRRDNAVARATLARWSAFVLPPRGALERRSDSLRLTSRAPIPLDASLPNHSRGAMHLATTRAHSLDIVALDVNDAQAIVAESTIVFRDVAKGTDAVHVIEPERVEEIRVLRDREAPTTFRWRIEPSAAIATLRVREGFVEALDHEGRARLRMSPPFAIDARGNRRALDVRLAPDGVAWSLALSLDTAGLELPIAVDPAWGATNTMAVARAGHRATLLSSGKVLVAGGNADWTTIHSSAEVYDPATTTWTLAKSMAGVRASYAIATLPDGKAIVAAGCTNPNWREGCDYPSSTSEIYDPATDTWTAGKPLPKRHGHPAYGTSGGKFMLASGTGEGFGGGSIYDATTDTWSASVNGMPGRVNPAFALTGSGRLLLAGGESGTRSVSLLDPITNTFTSAAPMAVLRKWAGAVTLADGRVLVAGGGDAPAGSFILDNSYEIYDPTTDAWSARKTFTRTFLEPMLVLYAPNRVFVGGGSECLACAPSTATEIIDLVANSASVGPPMIRARAQASMTKLLDGRVLVVGGDTTGTWGKTSLTGTATAEILGDALKAGSACTASGACASALCVDGFCCDRACTGSCESCSVTGKEGTCTLLTGSTAVGKATCVGSGTCGGKCDGTSTGCVYPTTECVAGSCTGGTAIAQAFCDGTGACPATTIVTCAPYGCGSVSCKTTCTSDTDCIGGRICEISTGKCVDKKARGAICSATTECTTGFCADGRCCDKACAGACEACDVAASEGVCTMLDGVNDKHGKCGSGPCADACKAGACSYKPATSSCGATCTGSTLATAGTCSGTDDKCAGAATSACPDNFKCKDDGTGCKTKCLTNDDCAVGLCDILGRCMIAGDAGGETSVAEDAALPIAETGTTLPDTPKVGGDFTRCTKDSECSTGHCVDGICCDKPCKERCHSCLLPSSPGKCVPAPIGVDFKQECGPAQTCLGTCDGSGQCIGAGQGTMCVRNRCVGPSKGLGPAYCAGPGAACNDDQSVAFECGSYACEPAFGACLTSCASSDDCARGYLCDVPTKTCVAVPPPPEEDSGCAMGRPSPFGGGATLALLAALGLLRRRRSRTSVR